MIGLLGWAYTPSFLSNSTLESSLSGLILISSSHQPVLTLGIAPTQVQDCIWSFKVHMSPLIQVSWWHPVSQECQLHHSAWCQLKTCWERTWSYCLYHWWRYQNSTGLSINPWGIPLVTDLWHQTIDHYPLGEAIQPVPHPPNSPLIKSIYPQFKEKVFGRMVSKVLQKFR